MENTVREFLNEVFGEVRAFEENGQIWFCANDVLSILEYSESGWRKKISRLNQKGVTKRRLITNGGKQETNFINESALLTLINTSFNISKEKREELLEWLSNEGLIKNKNIIIERKELKFLKELEKNLNFLNIIGIRQYQVLNYRIDYYIPSLNIAIEYDENNHNGYTYEEHEGRQKEIENELGCKFIRVSDKNSDYDNVEFVFNKIVECCLNKNLYIEEINSYMNYLLNQCKELENEINNIRNLQNKRR